jgi:hypothetical protein
MEISSRYMPIVTPESIDTFNHTGRLFKEAIIPYHTTLDEPIQRFKEKLHRETRWILSSIMPDELLEEPETHRDFHRQANELGVEMVIAWDSPTYLEDKKGSKHNMLKAIRITEWLEKQGLKIIPLIKGAYQEHIIHSTDQYIMLGHRTLAFHITEYLTTTHPPYPEIPEPHLTPKNLMYRHIEAILTRPLQKLILIGGSNPRIRQDLLKLDKRIAVAGYSWYLNAQNMTLHSHKTTISLKTRYIECQCPSCTTTTARDRRKPGYIARHNLIIDKATVEDLDIETWHKPWDLILDPHEDLLITGALHVGLPESQWRTLIETAHKIKPSYLITTNQIDTTPNTENQKQEWTEYIETLKNLWKQYGTITIPMRPPRTEEAIPLTRRHTLLYQANKDPLTQWHQTTPHDNTILTIIRHHNHAKTNLEIKKETHKKPVTLKIITTGLDTTTPPEQLTEYYKGYRHRHNWLIITSLNQPYIDPKNKVANPGTWLTHQPTHKQPQPAALHLTKNAQLKIIKPKK